MDSVEADHRVIVCMRCRGVREVDERPGVRLMTLLADAFGDSLAAPFRLDEVNCIAGCERPLAVAFAASGKASYLFGDIDPERDLSALVAFARFYQSLPDGWSNERQRPAGLAGKTLARIPAAFDAAAP